MIATVVTTGNSRMRIPVPKMPMARVEAKDKANAVQMNMASVVAIDFRWRQVLQVSWVTSLKPWGSLSP